MEGKESHQAASRNYCDAQALLKRRRGRRGEDRLTASQTDANREQYSLLPLYQPPQPPQQPPPQEPLRSSFFTP